MSTDKEDDAVASVLLALRSKWAAADTPSASAPDLASAPGFDSSPEGSRKRVREEPELTAAAGVYCGSFTHMVSCVSLSLLNALSSALSISLHQHPLCLTRLFAPSWGCNVLMFMLFRLFMHALWCPSDDSPSVLCAHWRAKPHARTFGALRETIVCL